MRLRLFAETFDSAAWLVARVAFKKSTPASSALNTTEFAPNNDLPTPNGKMLLFEEEDYFRD